MNVLQASLMDLWSPSVQRLTKIAEEAEGISVVSSGLVDDADVLFQFGLCCESVSTTESDVTFSLSITSLQFDPSDEAKVRATVGWFRSMVDYKDNRHPGYSIFVRQTPCFTFRSEDSADKMIDWIAPLEQSMRKCIARGKPPSAMELSIKKLFGISRGREDLILKS